MTEERNITEETRETKCFCQSKGFRKFLTIALGTFVGVYAALCLFTALHRPPMMPMGPMGFGQGGYPMQTAMKCPCRCHKHHFKGDFKGDRADFHKHMHKQGQPAPFEANRTPENN